MTAMLSGVVMIAALGLVAAGCLILVGSLYRVSRRAAAGSDTGRADREGG
jgi:hypothetical protein